MEGSLKELAEYRLERGKEMLAASESNLEIGQYKTSLNRSYYAVFHAMRSANALKEYDSSKHSGVIAFFTKEYLKTEILDRNLASIIKESSLCREKSDYDDFYVAGKPLIMKIENGKKRWLSEQGCIAELMRRYQKLAKEKESKL